MKVFKIADIVNNVIVFCAKIEDKPIINILCSCRIPDNARDICWEVEWKFDVKGKDPKICNVPIPPLISSNDSLDSPIFLGNDKLIFFMDRLFKPERIPRSDAEREEIILRTKKIVYDEQADLVSLKSCSKS